MYNEKDIISKWNSEMYDCNETDTNDVEFALSVIGVESKRILEIACGSGRFLVPMANAGHNVTGLDFDEHMLNRIATKTASTQNIHWHKSDVINDEWETGFDVVLLVANFLSNIVSDMDYEQAQELMIKNQLMHLCLVGMFSLTTHIRFILRNGSIILILILYGKEQIAKEIQGKWYCLIIPMIRKRVSQSVFVDLK